MHTACKVETTSQAQADTDLRQDHRSRAARVVNNLNIRVCGFCIHAHILVTVLAAFGLSVLGGHVLMYSFDLCVLHGYVLMYVGSSADVWKTR